MHARTHACIHTHIHTQTEDKYFKVDVVVHAPVLFLPVSEESPQSFVLDLGSVSIQNTLLIPDHTAGNIGIDAYGIKLDSFKVSRYMFIEALILFAYMSL